MKDAFGFEDDSHDSTPDLTKLPPENVEMAVLLIQILRNKNKEPIPFNGNEFA